MSLSLWAIAEDATMAILRRVGLVDGSGAPSGDPLALKIANDLDDLNDAPTARTNLGLGTAATLDHGTSNGNLVRLDATGLPAVDGSQLLNLPGGGAYSLVTSEAELATALAASAPLIAITADLTLTKDQNADVDTVIKVAPGVTFAKGAYAIIVAAGVKLTEDLNGGGLITWSRASGQAVQLGSGASITVRGYGGATLTNSGSASTWYATDTENQAYFGLTVNLPNVSSAGFKVDNTYFRAKDVVFVGGGSSCLYCVNSGFTTNGVVRIAENITLAGTFSTGDDVFYLNKNGHIKGLSCQGAGTSHSVIAVRIDNAHVVSGSGSLNLTAQHLTNVETIGASDNGWIQDFSGVHYWSSFTTGRMFDFFGLIHAKDGEIISPAIYFVAKSTFSGVNFRGGATTGAKDDVGFVNCKFGADAGSGSLTLTISSGADRTRVAACMTDAAISDSGTSSAISADTNTVY